MTEHYPEAQSNESVRSQESMEVLRALAAAENHRQAVLDTADDIDLLDISRTLEKIKDEIDENGPIKQQIDVLKHYSNVMIVQLKSLEDKMSKIAHKHHIIQSARAVAENELDTLRAEKKARVRELVLLQNKNDVDSINRRKELYQMNESRTLGIQEHNLITTIEEADQALVQLAPDYEALNAAKTLGEQQLVGYQTELQILESRLQKMTIAMGRFAAQLASLGRLADSPAPVTSATEPLHFIAAYGNHEEEDEAYQFIPSHERANYSQSINEAPAYHADGTPDLMGFSGTGESIIVPIEYEQPEPVDRSALLSRFRNRAQVKKNEPVNKKIKYKN